MYIYEKYKTKQWDGSYIDNTIIGIINRMLKAKAEHNLGISDITDTQLLTITPEDAKKKYINRYIVLGRL